MARILAAADIGSNTAHLLVAATDGEIVMRIDNMNEWIPLGEIVARTGEIPKEQADQLVGAVKEFRKVASGKRADRLYIFATEAVRSASNHAAILKRIKSEAGVVVDIIPPSRETELSFYGIRLDTKETEPDLMFEVGGGSAQVALVTGREIIEQISLKLGTGRILAESGMTHPCPPDALERAQNYIQERMKSCDIRSVASPGVIASGGVARGLWRALHPDSEKWLEREELEYLIWATQRLSIERITERFNVKPKRAGTLLPGAIVYNALLNHFGATRMMISEFGVREGAVLEMARNRVKGQSI